MGGASLLPSSIQARSYALGLGLGPLEHFQKLAAREGKVTKGWGCLTRRFKRWKVKVKFLSRVQLFVTPRTIAYQASPSMGFSRQECWNGLPFPSPGDLPDPEIEPGSPTLQADTLPSEPPGRSEGGNISKYMKGFQMKERFDPRDIT